MLKTKYSALINNHFFQFAVRNLKFGTGNLTRGFTLIELLVTISIIGVLSSILYVNLLGFRERSRDTLRKRDLRVIQTALELYRADLLTYPPTLPNCGLSLQNGAVTYIRQIPCDPLTKRKYDYSSAANTYTLFACLENVNDLEKDSVIKSACSIASFTVLSP